MSRTLYLAWRYVMYHKFKSIVMVSCITLTTVLPIALGILLSKFNQQIVSRATSTPLVVGAKGSRLDLVMHALYFQTPPPGHIQMGEIQSVGDRGTAIPIHARIRAQKVPVVGTTLEYFNLRQLNVARGEGLIRLGDCVLGYQAAQRLGLNPGDTLLTDRENILDIAGNYPLKMRVRGILGPNRTADDNVVFVDLKTAWIVEGLGHGHQDLADEDDEVKILDRNDQAITASAAVLPYTEINDENLASFHFHGDQNEFPITALIVIPRDIKSETQLLGRYQSQDATGQMSQPTVVVNELLSLVFRVQRFFNANAALIGVSTVLMLILVTLLSIRLRQQEMQTMFKIGCRRSTMAWLVGGELLIVFLCSAVLVGGLAGMTNNIAGDVVRSLLRAQ